MRRPWSGESPSCLAECYAWDHKHDGAPRDLLVVLMSEYVPSIGDFLGPSKARPPDWVKEIFTEVRGAKGGKMVTYRLGTLTCKEALPTGVAPARAAIWLADHRIPADLHPPEIALDVEPFFKELEEREICTQVSLTESV